MTSESWIVYGRDSCNYCVLVKGEMDKLGVEYDYINLSIHPELRCEYDSEYKTYPAVIAPNGELIGGYSEFKPYYDNMNKSVDEEWSDFF